MKNVFKKNSGKKIVFLLLAILSFNSATFASTSTSSPSISGSLSDLTTGLWSGIKSGCSYVQKQLPIPTLTPSTTLLLPCKDEIQNLRIQQSIITNGLRNYHSGTFTPGYITQINKAVRDLTFDKGLNYANLIRTLADGKQCMAEYAQNIDETLKYIGAETANGLYTNAGYGDDIFAAQESLNTDLSKALSAANAGNVAKDGYVYASNPVCPFHDSISETGVGSELAAEYAKGLTSLQSDGLHNFEQCMQKPVLKSALLKKAYDELTANKANVETQASKASWEHTKYYARKLWESCDLHPALKLAIIGATGSLATYGIGYKVIWKNLMYRPYKWWNRETPSWLNYRIAMLLRDASAVDGLGNRRLKAVNQDQLNALITKLKNY